MPSTSFYFSLFSVLIITTSIYWAHTTCQAIFYVCHNSPINRSWCILQDHTPRNVSDGCDTGQSSASLHASKYHAVPRTHHSPHALQQDPCTLALCVVYLSSWAAELSRWESAQSLMHTGTQFTWGLAISKPSFVQIREWGREYKWPAQGHDWY